MLDPVDLFSWCEAAVSASDEHVGLRWFAALTAIFAAATVAWGSSAKLVTFGFVVFVVSSATWVLIGAVADEFALLSQNAALFGINVMGVWRWMRRV